MAFIRTQGDKRLINLSDIKRVYWNNFVAKAELFNGEIVILGEYESADEVQHVIGDCQFLLKFIRRFNFPQYGYYREFYQE